MVWREGFSPRATIVANPEDIVNWFRAPDYGLREELSRVIRSL